MLRALVRLLMICIVMCGSLVDARAVDLAAMVRDLINCQDRAVGGSAASHAESTKNFARIEELLPSLSADDWKQPRNYRAAVTYVLAGGSPWTLKRLLAEHLIEDKEGSLLAASLAYAEGDKDKAAKLLSSIDAKSFPAVLAGHLALVQGGMLIGADDKRAAALFDYARLVMPGSLVEEAALRRELTIVDPGRETDRYLLLARRYKQRYEHSPFARKYWEQLSASILKKAVSLDSSKFAEAEELFKVAPAAVGFEFYTAAARAGILNARPELLKAQIQAATALADTPQAKDRLKLYIAAVSAIDGDTAASEAELRKIDTASLIGEEVLIMRVLSSVGSRLAGTPAATSIGEKQGDQAPESPLIRSVQRTLDDSEALLRKADGR